MIRRLGLALLLSLVVAAPAQATTVSVEDGSPDFPYQRWLDRAQVPTPEGELRIVESFDYSPDCPGACINSTSRILWFGGGFGRSVGGNRSIFMHEIGHWFAYTVRGDPDGEPFADRYSRCALQQYWGRWTYGVQRQFIDGPTGWAFRTRVVRRTCRQARAR